MFPRRLIGLASLPLSLGFATDSFAQRRPEPPPVVYQTQVPPPERYQIAEQEVLARLREPPPLPCAQATCPPQTTVVIRHEEPVDAYYGRRRHDPPPLPCPPPVVYVEPCAPPVVYCPPPRPVYVCPPVVRYDDCRPSYRGYYEGRRSYRDSGLSLSFSFGDDCDRSSFRFRGGDRRDYGRGHDRGGRDRRRRCN